MFLAFKYFWILFLFPSFELKFEDNTICNYRAPKANELVIGITTDKELSNQSQESRKSTPNLRIHFDYQLSFTKSSQATSLINSILEPAKIQLQKLILPKSPTEGILRVDRSCKNNSYRISPNGIRGCAEDCVPVTSCLNISVPEQYLKQCSVVNASGNVIKSGTQGNGIANVDIVLLVTYTECKNFWKAYATSCFLENSIDRPILGILNICPNQMQPNKSVKENIKFVIHQIIHALGIAGDKYAFYRFVNGTPIVPRNQFGYPNNGINPVGNFYKWNDKIIRQYSRSRSSITVSKNYQFYGFILPNVLAAARDHFNCSTLSGVDIENFASVNDPNTLSHFDEYFLNNELMTIESNFGMDTLSNLTLGLLQDTGWYNVNYSESSKLDYGYKKGCILPEKGCYTYMQTQMSKNLEIEPFCKQPLGFGQIYGCSLFKDYFSTCSLIKWSQVSPSEFQYFQSLPGIPDNDIKFYSGSSVYNEYCPVQKVTIDPSSICNNELNNNIINQYNILPSYYGTDSKCFLNDLYGRYEKIYYGASCQKYNIFMDTLTIIIGSQTFSCKSNFLHNFTLADGKTVVIKCPENAGTIVSTPTSSSTTINILTTVSQKPSSSTSTQIPSTQITSAAGKTNITPTNIFSSSSSSPKEILSTNIFKSTNVTSLSSKFPSSTVISSTSKSKMNKSTTNTTPKRTPSSTKNSPRNITPINTSIIIMVSSHLFLKILFITQNHFDCN